MRNRLFPLVMFIACLIVLALPVLSLAQDAPPPPVPVAGAEGAFLALVPALGSLLIAVLSWVAVQGARLLQANVKNSYLQGALVRLDDAVFTAVKMVSQTYVDALKAANEDGVITREEAADAKQKAIDAAKSYLGAKGLAAIAQVLGLTGPALDGFLGAKIEAAVADTKQVASPS